MTTMQGAGVPGVKIDPDGKLGNNWIKAEPSSMELPTAMQIDDDIYEDAGDLDFSAASQGLYLTRIPKMLWESWSQLDDDQEIRLGTVRVEGSLNEIKRMSLMLAPDVAARATLPKEYVLDVTHQEIANTFVFSEKDLPGYTSRLQESTKLPGESALTQRSMYQNRSTNGPHGIDRNRKSQGRRGVPKQTAIAGRVQKEFKCVAVDNDDFRRVIDIRSKRENQKKTTSFKRGAVGTDMSTAAGKSFESFIKTNKSGKKSQKIKAARIPMNDLLDQIFDCFSKFQYWSLKNLVHELRQPELYLKQTLEGIAHLIKSGHHSGLWQVKPEFRREGYENVKSEQAPDVASPKGSEFEFEDVEDENVEMEEVDLMNSRT